MVLFKRKNVTIPETKLIPAEEDQEVWVIPETEEVFCTYDDFLSRMDFYMQRKFICELSGASCLTYFEALKRENQEKKQVLKSFPEPLREPILRMVQFSLTTRLDQLVDEVHSAIKEKFYVGENVSVRFQDQKVRADVVKADHEHGIYQVDDGLRVLEGDFSQLQRDRKLLSKPALRAFVKHSAYREPWLGSPWMLREAVAEKYGISTEVPQQILDLKERNGHLTSNSVNGSGDSKGGRSSGGNGPSGPVRLAPKTASVKASSNNGPSPKQLNQSYMESRALALKQLEDQIPLELRNDDLFDLAKSDEPLMTVITHRNKIQPWPQWHKDASLDAIEGANKINHLLEIWLFSHYFSELIDFTDHLQKFDDFVAGLLSHEPSEEVSKLHECLLSMLVTKNSKKLAIPLPEESSDEESSSEDEAENDDDGEEEDGEESNNKEDDNEQEEEEEEEEEDADDEKEEDYDSDSENGPPRKKHKNNKSSKSGKAENPWVVRIGKRDYKNGGWQQILVEILQKLVHSSEWHPDTREVVAHFTGDTNSHHEISDNDALEAYKTLLAPQRIHALMMLARLLYGSDLMRDFLDTQYDTASKIRRQAHTKELKQYREEQKSAQKLLNMTIDHDHDPSSVSVEQMKELAVELNLEESFTPEEVKELISDMSDKIDKTVEILNETSKTLARMDNQRMRLLGKDRFFNRYWWMDSNGVDQSGNLYMGRLWVQGPSDADREYLQSEFFTESFIKYRRDVLNETARVKSETARLITQQLKANSAEKEPKIKAKSLLKPRLPQNESSRIKFINQVGSKPPPVKRSGPVENPNRILTDLGNLERRLRELIQVSKHNGDLLCADDTIELRQLESELLESRKNLADSPTEVVQRNIKKVVTLFAENFPASQFGREAYLKNHPEAASAPEASTAAPVDNASTSTPSAQPQQSLIKTKFKMVNPDGGKPSQQSGVATTVHTQTKFIDGTPKNVSSTIPSVQTVYNPSAPEMAPAPAPAPAPSAAPLPPNALPSAPSSVPPSIPPPQSTPGVQPPLVYDPYKGVYTTYQPGYHMDPAQQPQQQPMQWVVQQTSQGPMMYAVPVQHMIIPQYGDTGDAYNAYIQQQLGMQQAYYAQQMQQYHPYYQHGQYGAPMVPMGYQQVPAYGQVPPEYAPPPPGYEMTPTPQPPVQLPAPQIPAPPQPESNVVGSAPGSAPGSGAVAHVSNQPERGGTEANNVKSVKKGEVIDLVDSDSDEDHTKKKTEVDVTKTSNGEQNGEKTIQVKQERELRPAPPSFDTSREQTVEAEPIKPDLSIVEGAKIELAKETQQRDDSESAGEEPEYVIKEDPIKPTELVTMQTNGPLAPYEWRFYDTPDELDQLLSYFGNSGKREVKLGSALRKLYPEIRSLMSKRLKDLEDPRYEEKTEA